MSRWAGCSAVMSTSPIEIVPSVISSSPAIIRSSVDLPQPDGPTRTMNSPSAIERLTSSTATTPPANDLVTCSSSIPAIVRRLIPGLHRAHDVDLRLERHIAGVDGEDGAGNGRGFVAREVHDEGCNLLGCRHGQDMEASDGGARVPVVEPYLLRFGRDDERGRTGQ